MQIVIDIPEDLKKMIFDDEMFDVAHSYRLAMCVKNGTPLPDNATNGEMVKAIFPNAEITVGCAKGENITMVYLRNNNMIDASFYRDWWNAPYKAESEDNV